MPTDVKHNDIALVESACGQSIKSISSAPELSDNALPGGVAHLTQMILGNGIKVIAKYDEEAKTPYFVLSAPTPTKGVGSKSQ